MRKTGEKKAAEIRKRFEKITEAHNFIIEYLTDQKLDIYSVIFILDTTKHELLTQQLKKIGDANG
jgi:broad-specificity NMP kinase